MLLARLYTPLGDNVVFDMMLRVLVVPVLGARQLRDLSADDVDRWLDAESRKVSTRTLRLRKEKVVEVPEGSVGSVGVKV